MSSSTESGGFLRRNYLVIFVFLAYAEAAASPFMALKWDSPFLIFWSALLLSLLTISFFKLLHPVAQPRADLCFVVCLILALDLFSVLLGPDSRWLQPMNYVLIALCAVYYSLGFNFIVAALIFVLQLMGIISSSPAPKSYASLAVFGAYLLGTALILGSLFQSEQKKKEKAMLAVRRIHEGAAGLTPGEEQQLSSISPQGRFSNLVETAAELDRVLEELLLTVKTAIPCDNAMIFMATEDEGGLYLRLYIGSSELADSPDIALGQGLTGWVAKEKKPVLVKDGARGLGYLKDEREVNAFLAVPIMNGGFLEGVIALDSSTGSFTEKDKESLIGFASLALHVLQNARAYQRVDMSAKEFEALHRISAELSSSLDLKTILEKLATCSREIIAYDYLTVSFMEGPGTAAFKILKGYDGLKIPEGPIPIAGSLLGWIVENRQELCFTDLDQRAQKFPVFPDGLLKTEFKSFLGIPFLSQDACMGVFTIAMRAPGAITAYQHQTLSIISNQVAVNIANAKFHHMMEKMATTDGLTGLTNHRAFQEKADQGVRKGQEIPPVYRAFALRYRPLQEDQRQPRPPRRGRGAEEDRKALERNGARSGCGGPLRRRRVRRAPRKHRLQGRLPDGREDTRQYREKQVPVKRPEDTRHRKRRFCSLPGRREGKEFAYRDGRPGPVCRQGRRPQPVPRVQGDRGNGVFFALKPLLSFREKKVTQRKAGLKGPAFFWFFSFPRKKRTVFLFDTRLCVI